MTKKRVFIIEETCFRQIVGIPRTFALIAPPLTIVAIPIEAETYVKASPETWQWDLDTGKENIKANSIPVKVVE